jgi:hypothetical protein
MNLFGWLLTTLGAALVAALLLHGAAWAVEEIHFFVAGRSGKPHHGIGAPARERPRGEVRSSWRAGPSLRVCNPLPT